METFDSIFQLAAGIGLFLFSLYLIEESLKNLSGRNFKLFLQRITKNRVGAAIGGAVITGILQSGSMISLMVLAFVGAGVFTVKNALAIILGSNLGAILPNWLIVTLGFQSNIATIAYPTICLGGFILSLFGNRQNYKLLSFFLLGFGLFLLSFSLMKAAMDSQLQYLDWSKYASMPLFTGLMIGFIITLIAQSGTVTTALALTALHSHTIDFPMAAILVLGTQSATTIKVVVAAIGGNAPKKRVALGNILYSFLLTIIVFIFLKPILNLITDTFKIKDLLIALAFFSTLINIIGLVIFLPFINLATKFLEYFFKDSNVEITAFIKHASINEPLTAMDLLRRETYYFINNSILFNIQLFEIETDAFQKNSEFNDINKKSKFLSKSLEEKYDFLKLLQGKIQVFYLELRTKIQSERQGELNQLISAVRNAMHSVKSIKDVHTDIADLRQSSKNIKYHFFLDRKKETENLYLKLNTLVNKEKNASFEELESIIDTIQKKFTAELNNFYSEAQLTTLESMDITTVINFNRELFTSNKAMLMAVKDLLLDEKSAQLFNEIPIYRT